MKKILKIGGITLGTLLFLFVLLMGLYKLLNSQGIIESYEVNLKGRGKRVLIATQGSDYKADLVSALIKGLEGQANYIKVIDVTSLDEVDHSDWEAIVLINTCEAGKMQPDAVSFLERVDGRERVVVVTTSGDGGWVPRNDSYDTISTASEKGNIEPVVDTVLARLVGIMFSCATY